MKHCPKCGSSRIHRGYAQHPRLLRFIGFPELLCDGCNLTFRSFVLPGTLRRSSRGKKKRHRRQTDNGNHRKERTKTAAPPHGSKPCPWCKGETTHRSHRRGIIEHLASTIGIYPYKCDSCNRKFLARRRRQ